MKLRPMPAAIAIALLFPSALAAQEPAARETAAAAPETTSLDVEQVIALLDQRSAALRAERLGVDIARGDEVTAGIIPNPIVSAQLLQTVRGDQGSFNGTQPQVVVSQEVPVAGQRRARIAHARREVARVEAEVELFFETAAREARRAFIALLARQERVEVLTAASTELENAANIVRGRAQAGDRSRYDVLRIDVERQNVEVALLQARTDRESAARELAVAIGAADLRPEAVGDLTPDAGVAAVPASVEEHPAVEVATRELDAAKAAVRVAEREAVPVPVVGAGAAFTTRNYASAGFVGVGMPIPVFDRNQGRIASARAAVHAAEARREAVLTELETERRRAVEVLAMRRGALETFENGVYASLPELQQMAQAAYRGGTSSILEVVDSLRTQRELELDHVAHLEAVKLAEVDVLAAAGRARIAR